MFPELVAWPSGAFSHGRITGACSARRRSDWRPSIRNPPRAKRRQAPRRLVRDNGFDEVLARATNLLIGRAAYETAIRLYPNDRIDYRRGARVIEKSYDDPLGT